ncbi:regulator of telomere elongation helicase 1 homolog isoform X1, partial [Tanacetum coccineum]
MTADYVKSNPDLGAEPIDIEDLVKLGKPDGPCPYHLSRELHKSVDILFAPYNYLIDPGNRKSLSIEWENSVLIFDEAHNLESVCSEAASFDLTYSVLDACNWEAYTCIDLANSAARDSQKYVFLRAHLLKLKQKISDAPLDPKGLSFSGPGADIYQLLKEIGIREDTTTTLLNTIEDATKILEKNALDSQNAKVCWLRIIFKESGNSHAKYYRVHIRQVERKPSISPEDYVKSNPDLGAEPIDIEDLVNLGKPDGPCPYHLSRELHKSVDILFAPYNYLIDPGNRKSLSIEWENSVRPWLTQTLSPSQSSTQKAQCFPRPTCKARGSDLICHFKNTKETTHALRNMSLIKAK